MDQRLVVGVLAELVAVAADGADSVLLDHVANGAQWDDAIYEISQSPGNLYRQLPAVLDARFPEDECVAIVHLAAELLEHSWSGALPKRLLHRLTVMLRAGEREELIAALETPGSGQRVAFQALPRLDDPGGMSVAETILRVDASGPERAAALRYLQNLSGEHTLKLARSWVGESDGRGVGAQGIFERHAEPSDFRLLANGLREAWEARDFYALCSFIDALARLSDPQCLEQIATIYEESEYSYARCRCARALIAISEQAFVDRYARSALWDCEREIQDLAVGLLGDHVDEVAARQIEAIEGQRK